MALEGVTKNCRRERIRLSYLAAAKIKTETGSVVCGNLRDIGIESVYIKINKLQQNLFTQDEYVDIDIIVTQGVSRLTIAVPGMIFRVDGEGVVVMFSEPLKWWPIFSLFPVNDQFLFDIVTQA